MSREIAENIMSVSELDNKTIRQDNTIQITSSEDIPAAAAYYRRAINEGIPTGNPMWRGRRDKIVFTNSAGESLLPVEQRVAISSAAQIPGYYVKPPTRGGAYSHIQNRLSHLDLSDSEIASAMMRVVTDQELPDHIEPDSPVGQEITHGAWLIFGTESARNPANLVLAKMTLDLVAHGKISLERALNDPRLANQGAGGVLPMTMEGAVAASRDIETYVANTRGQEPTYHRHPDSQYRASSPDLDLKDEMARREINILVQWGEAKLTETWVKENISEQIVIGDDPPEATGLQYERAKQQRQPPEDVAKKIIKDEIERRMIQFYSSRT